MKCNEIFYWSEPTTIKLIVIWTTKVDLIWILATIYRYSDRIYRYDMLRLPEGLLCEIRTGKKFSCLFPFKENSMKTTNFYVGMFEKTPRRILIISSSLIQTRSVSRFQFQGCYTHKWNNYFGNKIFMRIFHKFKLLCSVMTLAVI